MKSQIVIAGVGGQGVLFAAGIFMEAARQKGVPVLASETHGMSQRGGSVTSHLKIGDFESPLVAEGDADLLLGLEPTEALRTLTYLRSGGSLCVVSVPKEGVFPDVRVADELKRMEVEIHGCAADATALNLGNIRAANLVLLGFASNLKGFPFTFEEIRAALDAVSSPNQRSINLKALDKGRELNDLVAA